MTQDPRPARPGTDAPLDALRQQAADGTPEALARLAMALVARGEIDEAAALHLRAANAGHVGAQVEVARMLLYGVGAETDPRSAVEWLLRAEAAGSFVAGYFLALVALGATVLPRDGRIGQRLQRAVEQDYPPALRAAAVQRGRGAGAEDQAQCLALLDRAAMRGDAVAALLLAARLAHGEGTPADPARAAMLHEQLARAGHPPLPRVDGAVRRAGASGASNAPGLGALAFDLPAVDSGELLATRPEVRRIDGLLSADECRLLLAASRPWLRRSQTVDPQTGAAAAHEIRTSSDCSFDPLMEDFALRAVQLRMADAARTPLACAERLIVLRYQPGEQYRPHRDYLPPGAIERDGPASGNRRRTICVYLNEVEAGGETAFPAVDASVSPQAGRAVVFDNLTADGTPDPDSLHAGLPVQRGEKWLATLWLRERPYRAF